MQIETKLSPEDSAWMMRDDKPVEVKIEGIVIIVTSPKIVGFTYSEGVDIFYIVRLPYNKELKVSEELIWPTKRALLDSL